ncbi:MAG: TIGR04141 family sporadically distributed protein [Pseudolabrys sp.]|nr:TIGR04141 family sporadically distributed protein [Pseudolabrys sp.]MDP2296138.1 TIGR04141 family sporadically distributed protein [Pseudolabrys sp.]
MSKSRSFSIYLLKKDFDATNALKDDHRLDDQVEAEGLPEGASLFVLDSPPRPPWWKDYFRIDKILNQASKGALIFLPVDERCFALSFGHVSHNLKDASYEYDFGLRVTLNCVDPNELKSTDSLEPGVGRRQRTQLPVGSDLTLFDFDRDSSILRRLTGKVKTEHKELFKHATGASNLRVSSDVESAKLGALCEALFKLYESEDYKKTFPEIQNIAPVRDPSLIKGLDDKLIAALRTRDDGLNLTVPDLINYEDNVYATFAGAGASLNYDDVFMARYYEYLDEHGVDVNALGVNELRHHSLVLTDEDRSPRERHTVYKSLIFDTAIDGTSFHLCDGNWYKVEKDYVSKIEKYLDPYCVEIALPAYHHDSEGAYNQAVAVADNSIVCLDEKNISPTGQHMIEPCDLYSVLDGHAVFQHVKVSTLSAKLSHLFNQGTNAIEVIRLEEEALGKLQKLIKENVDDAAYATMIAPLADQKHHVMFVIVTHKDKGQKSKNLPLFSRISLMRNMKALQVRGVRAGFGFVDDQNPKMEGTKKKPKKKG